MELRQYWLILKGRLWVVLVLVALTLVSSIVLRPEYQESYRAQIRVAIKPRMEQPSVAFYSTEYYNYVASEYLVDDIAAIIETNAFLGDVRERLKTRPEGPPSGAIATEKAHRVLTIKITSSKMQDALDIARTVGEILTEPASKYFSQLSDQNPIVSIVQPPFIEAATGERRAYLDITLRAILGLLVGVGLAFLLDYLDDSIRGRSDVERVVGLPVLGELPRERRRGLRN